ncbi:MAG TPA: SurA N-terminal domain-containing protein [Ferruginibacter sp.]|nr:SurA N-terminal domain-containing protein [Ferruginibacter sp.]HMP19893.1 SurA N-terminal domain-containing protein [Ferruginibacter sp.]
MQIIQNIREKGAAIVIVIIALSLIGFILMDANLGSRNSASASPTIGKVNGVKIEAAEYNDKVKQIEDQYGGRVSGPQVYQIRQSAWDQIVAEKVLEEEFEKLGFVFTPRELSTTMFSDDAPYTLKQAFTDKASGQYDIAKAQQWWQTAKKSKGEQRQAIEQQIVEPMRLQALYTRYSGMLAAGGYYPAWLKEKETAETKTFANISFVHIPYNIIPDSSIQVSDDDIMDYVKSRKNEYKQEAGRYISYITFSTSPTGADSTRTLESVMELKDAFAADTNAKAFVARNISAREFDDVYVPKSKLSTMFRDTLASIVKGNVYGPYLDANEYVLAKKIDTKILPDSVKCRHILIGTMDRQTGEQLIDDSTAKKRIDSVELAIKTGASFDALEAQYSTDQAAHADKGVMTFDIATIQNKQGFAPEFGEFLLNEKGETKKTVKTNFGWHYIEILEKKNPSPAYKIAYLAKEIIAGDETVNTASAKATKLAGEVKNYKALDAYVAKNGYQKIDIPTLVKENDFQVGSLQDARQLIKWAFDAKEGEISEPFNIGESFVVAAVNKVQDEGLPEAKTIRPQVEYLVRTQKKAAQIKAKIKSASTLEAVATAYGQQVSTAGADSTLTFSSQIITGVGQEPKVIGAAFNKQNQAKISQPISGNSGVFVIKVNNTGNLQPDSAEEIAKKETDRARALAQQLNAGWFEALKKLSVIKDDRSKIN